MVSTHSRQTLLGLLHLYSTITSQLQAVHDQINWFQRHQTSYTPSSMIRKAQSTTGMVGFFALVCIGNITNCADAAIIGKRLHAIYQGCFGFIFRMFWKIMTT